MVVPVVSSQLYPFTGHRFDRGGGIHMNYVDEGSGPPVLMLHGNPTWSFYYRNLIRELAPRHRVIAPDHVGCGLSDRPGDDAYDFRLATRVADVGRLVDHLDLREPLTLVVHDWGGMIGMAWAVANPERIARLVILNTGAFPLPAAKPFPWPIAIAKNTSIGARLVSHHNAFARVAARVCVTRRPLPASVREGYLAPYEGGPERSLATLRFVEDIPLRPGDPSWETLSRTAELLPTLRGKPVFIGWGDKDFVFDKHFLAEWRRLFPDATVRAFADAGHYVLEDAAEELLPAIRQFIDG
ncbi:MAG: alpha/beta fold hydrolase [Myxococcales bacterium]|nr:MAG: alpha/beta fold hydrolase [Myxococcales bacterium]